MKVKVDSKINYAGIVAIEKINNGEIVLLIKGNVIPSPTKYTIQLAPEKHIESFTKNDDDENSIWRFVNHSCEPNCQVNTISQELTAIKNILPGEEITFDYNTTEEELIAPFECKCNSQKCNGNIRGAKHLKEKSLFS